MIGPTPVDDGKYTFSIPEGDYRIHVLRHGEPWLVIEQGSKAIHSLLSELIDSRELIAALTAWGGYDDIGPRAGQTGELHEAIRKFRSIRGLSVAAQIEAPADELKAKIAAVLHEYDERVSRAFGVLKTCHRDGLLDRIAAVVAPSVST